jgi:hypothetical protein
MTTGNALQSIFACLAGERTIPANRRYASPGIFLRHNAVHRETTTLKHDEIGSQCASLAGYSLKPSRT